MRVPTHLRRLRAASSGLLVLAAVLVATACNPLLPPLPVPTTPPPPTTAPGDLLTVEASSFSIDPLLGLAMPFTESWRVLYRSENVHGEPIDVSGTVIVPTTPWLGGGARPVVAYAPGTRGLGDKCAPSRTLPTGGDYEATFIEGLLLRGWAVAVTDYEGLGTAGQHTYMVGGSQGKAVLDMARGARNLADAGLSDDSPIGLMGYSQGGAAVGWAAELAPTYAPELPLVGVAAGGVPADLVATGEYLDGQLAFALALLAAIGNDAAYPELDLQSYLNADGQALYDRSQDICIVSYDGLDAIVGNAFKTFDDFTTTSPLDTAIWQDRLGRSTLGSRAPQVPVHLYHASLDEIAPLASAQTLRDTWCAAGAQVDWQQYPLAEHLTGVFQGYPAAADFLSDRFAGKPVTSSC